MRTRTSALWACLLALALNLSSLSAEARPERGSRVRALQGLLVDLARRLACVEQLQRAIPVAADTKFW